MPNYQETVLKNGLRLITSTNENSALAVASLWLRTGSRYETKEESGYSHFLEHLLCKNLKDFYNSADYNRIGAYINGRTTRDSMFLIAEVSAKYTKELISVLSASINKLDNDTDKFETQKKIIIQEMRMRKDNPQKSLIWSALKAFLGNHPLAKEPIGSLETIQNSTLDKIIEYQKKVFIPNRSALVVISNLAHEEVLKLASSAFSSWEAGSDPEPDKEFEVSKEHEKYLYLPNTSAQTYMVINFHTPGTVNMKDEADLIVLANYLGSGQKALLQEKLRHETGLVYTVNVFNIRFKNSGIFQITTSSSDPARAINIIFDSLSNFLTDFTPEILEETKERVINNFDRFNSNPRNEADFLGQGFVLFDRLFKPEDYKKLISEVTYEDVINVGKRYLNRENSLVAISGSEDIKDKI